MFIIILMQSENLLPIGSLEELAVCNTDGNLAIFSSRDDASGYQEEHEIDGQVFELPSYF